MYNKFLDIAPRAFSPLPVPGLSNKARDAVNAALDAMSAWRNETAAAGEKNGAEVVQKMAAAAKAMGWSEQVVDTVRSQIQNVSEMQIKTMDQIMDVWEQQLKLPDPTGAPASDMLSKLKSSAYGGPAGFESNPMQAWLQFVEQWQKNWAEAVATWTKSDRQP